MTYDSPHRNQPPRQGRWPGATPAEPWQAYSEDAAYPADVPAAMDRQSSYRATAGVGSRSQPGYPDAASGPADQRYSGYQPTRAAEPVRGPADLWPGAPAGYAARPAGRHATGGYVALRDGYAEGQDYAAGQPDWNRPDWNQPDWDGTGYRDARTEGYGPRAGHQVQAGYGTQAGYAPQTDYGTQAGYGTQADYAPQTDYGTQADYGDGFDGAADYGLAQDGYADAAQGYAETQDAYQPPDRYRMPDGYTAPYGYQAPEEYAPPEEYASPEEYGTAGGYGAQDDFPDAWGYAGDSDDFDGAPDNFAETGYGYNGDPADFAAAPGYPGGRDYAGSVQTRQVPAGRGPARRTIAGATLEAPDADVYPDSWQADQEHRWESRRRGLFVGAMTGFLAVASAIGVSTLAAAFVRPQASPMLVAGNVFIDRTPAAAKNFLAAHSGTHERAVLLLAMYVLVALFALGIGMLGRRAAALGVAGLAALTVLGAFITITRPENRVSDVVPSVLGGLAGIVALLWLVHASAPVAMFRPAHGGESRRSR